MGTTTFIKDSTLAFTRLSTPTPAGSTWTFPYTPGTPIASHVICCAFTWADSGNTVALNSIVKTSGAGTILWTVAGPKFNFANTSFQCWMGVPTVSGACTSTMTFSAGLAASSVAAFADEFSTSVASPAWSVQALGTNATTTTKPALTSGADNVPNGCFYYAECTSGASSLTSLSPLSWITYDTTDYMLWGDAPANEFPVPATGFTQSTAGNCAMPTMILNPGIVVPPASPLWVPPGVDLGAF